MLQPKYVEEVTLTYLLQTSGPRGMCWDELEKAVSEYLGRYLPPNFFY